MTVIPYRVPKEFTFDEYSYTLGHQGVIDALKYAAEARRLGAKNEDLAQRARRTGRRSYYTNRAESYRALELKWLACALNTALAARRILTDKQIERVKVERALARKNREPIVTDGPELLERKR